MDNCCVRVVTYGFGVSYGEVNDVFKKEDDLYEAAAGTFNNFVELL